MLSVAIATHNEEKNILRCLKSVYDWVDEIVIVDGSSRDKTVELIKKFDRTKKVKIFIEKNPPMFHINKQKAIERCSKPWILQLDADEEVSEELKEEILKKINSKLQLSITKPQSRTSSLRGRQILNSNNQNSKQNNFGAWNLEFGASSCVAFWLPRLNFFLGKPLKKGGQYPDYTLRLYRNGVARFPCKSVHEQVEIIKDSKLKTQNLKLFKNWKLSARPPQTGGKIGYLSSPLYHYPYPTFFEYLKKWNRYNQLEAENLKKQGFKPSLWNFIKYFFILPTLWFFKTYFRHLGFLDGFPGFIFSLFSAIRYWGIYVEIVEK